MKKKIFKIAAVMAVAVASVSCYEDYLSDYDYSAVYFASQKPLRTIIADRDMTIDVGVAISGKRNVDPKDWAKFEINMFNMVGSGHVLMPEEYYTLSDPEMMKVKKSNLPIASVTVSFTDEFYADPLSTTDYYAIPFSIVESSLDSILTEKSSTVVAVKYISSFHGTYLVKGKIDELDDSDDVVGSQEYGSHELSATTYARSTVTLARDKIVVNGLGDTFPAKSDEKIELTFGEDGAITAGTAEGGISLLSASGSYTEGENLKIDLSYTYVKEGKKYAVTETLLRRQDPSKDLIFEEW